MLLPTLDLGLYSRKSIFVYDSFVAILDKVAATFTFIDNTFLSTEVFDICFLQQHISSIFFVPERTVDIAFTPLVASDGFNALLVQLLCDSESAHAGEIISEDTFY